MKTYIIVGLGVLLLIGVLLFTAMQRQQQSAMFADATREHEQQLIAPLETQRAEINKLATPAR